MSSAIKVKPEYAKKVIGFNNKSLALGERTDLDMLYENAKRTGHARHLAMFEPVDDPEVEKSKTAAFLKSQEEKKAK